MVTQATVVDHAEVSSCATVSKAMASSRSPRWLKYVELVEISLVRPKKRSNKWTIYENMMVCIKYRQTNFLETLFGIFFGGAIGKLLGLK
jgi:hypothetical protein